MAGAQIAQMKNELIDQCPEYLSVADVAWAEQPSEKTGQADWPQLNLI